jgi:hypothetical protein
MGRMQSFEEAWTFLLVSKLDKLAAGAACAEQNVAWPLLAEIASRTGVRGPFEKGLSFENGFSSTLLLCGGWKCSSRACGFKHLNKLRNIALEAAFLPLNS